MQFYIVFVCGEHYHKLSCENFFKKIFFNVTFSLFKTFYRQEDIQVGRHPVPEKDIAQAYGKYSDMLYRVAFMQLGNREDAMDCVQDIFMKYMTAVLLFSSEEHEKAWLIRATVNRCHDIYRKNSIRNHDELAAAENVSYSEYFSEDKLSLAEAIEELPEKIRAVIVLHYLEGFSVEEISGILKTGKSAVKMRLSRGREALKTLLEKEEFNV